MINYYTHFYILSLYENIVDFLNILMIYIYIFNNVIGFIIINKFRNKFRNIYFFNISEAV